MSDLVGARSMDVDPILFEIIAHRLWALGEEGRQALQRVSASPIVVQGGECMSSFYAADGTMVLACSGHIRFAAATSDAIRFLIKNFGDEPGFRPGDQIFFNDPYVAGSHTYDQMVVAPIFVDGALVAWTASSSHTADVGGSLSGEPSEIFHEGIRVVGLKVVEAGEFRRDVYQTIVQQCRDPHYVGLDLRSRIAANNVCLAGFAQLVDRFGLPTVLGVFDGLVDEGERRARARLAELPDGVWRSRQLVAVPERGLPQASLCEIHVCLEKRDDALRIDFAGTSAELTSEFNATLPSTMAHTVIALTVSLFWDVPWSDGKMRPVTVNVPEGSLLNCSFPSACNRSPWVGQFQVAALLEPIAKMLYAAGRYDDVNASWLAYAYTGGPGFHYGGRLASGIPVAQGLYDIHGGGLGATPQRDGVDSGGHANIPAGGISDVERIELQYPFLYLTRRHVRDGAAPGKWRGGAGIERAFVIHKGREVTANFAPYTMVPQGGFGLFGGYPTGIGGWRAATDRTSDLVGLVDAVKTGGLAEVLMSQGARLPLSGRRIALGDDVVVADFTQSGGAYGDPLDRATAAVAADVAAGVYSPTVANLVFGLVLDPSGVDEAGTAARREEIRHSRIGGHPVIPDVVGGEPIAIPHGGVDIVDHGLPSWRCRRCHHILGPALDNYKRGTAARVVTFPDLGREVGPSGVGFEGCFVEYCCPVCGTLLDVQAAANRSDAQRLAAEPLHDISLAAP